LKKRYRIDGIGEIEGREFLIKEYLTWNERHTTASTEGQAKGAFRAKFWKKYKQHVYLGKAEIVECDEPRGRGEEQLKLFE